MSRSPYLPSILLIAIISISVYANTLKNGFVYDDGDTVVNNALIRDLRQLPKLFEGNDYFKLSGETSYRPVVTFTYFLDYASFGLESWGYHLTNILLHAVNSVLLFIFLSLVFKSPADIGHRSLLLVTLLFATHPALTEAVNAVSFREDLLVFLFYMATLIIYMESRSERPISLILYFFSCLTYFMALFSKEAAVTLPLTVYCLESIYAGKKKGEVRSIMFNRYCIGYVVITFIYAYFRFFCFYNPARNATHDWEMGERMLTIPWLIINYIKLAVIPVSLSADYLIRPVESVSSSFIAPVAVIVFLLTAALIIGQKERRIAFGYLFFILTLIPVYNIIPLANPFAERYLYLPTVGVAVVATSALGLIFKSSAPKSRNIHIILCAFIVIGIYSFAVIGRNGVWRDNFSLWSDAVKKMPQSHRSHYNLGMALDERGWMNEAMQHYQAAIRLDPADPKPFYNLGLLYARLNKPGKAAELYQIAIKLNPENSKYHYNLADVYYKQGRLDDAVRELKASLKSGPDYPDAHNNLGVIYGIQGRFNDAVQEYEIVLQLDPKDATARYNLGVLYLKKGLKDKAKTEFEASLKLRPDFQDARKALEQLAL